MDEPASALDLNRQTASVNAVRAQPASSEQDFACLEQIEMAFSGAVGAREVEMAASSSDVRSRRLETWRTSI